MAHHTAYRPAKPPHDSSLPLPRSVAGEICRVTYTALLTLALSLPQGLLALPSALAPLGLAPGLLILAGVGALNSVTVAWTAQQLVSATARPGTMPSLPRLAAQRLGTWGRRLTVASSGTLFFLALVASLVGLARGIEELTQAPALLGGALCGVVVLALSCGRAGLSARLLIGLGLLNAGLLVMLIVRVQPPLPPLTTAAPDVRSPLLLLGVSQMLFFAPLLVPMVAQQVLPQGGSARTLVVGSALGVAGSVGLAALWASAVYRAVGAASLAGVPGTVLAALSVAAPASAPLASLLGFLLLGMTAVRCAVVLRGLGAEHLPERVEGSQRQLLAQGPAALGLGLALVLLYTDTATFTTLIALAGGTAASLTSLVIPTLLTCASRTAAGSSPGGTPSWP